MKLVLSALALAFALIQIGSAQDATGDWQGTLQAAGSSLHLLFHITKAEGGSLKATMDSLDQNAMGIPITSVTVTDAHLTLEANTIHAKYDGKFNKDFSQIDGT